jgi:ring-1,2-phenylacetyl-CoA epoxidase subunit PaaD
VASNLKAAGIQHFKVEKVFQPAWTTEWITEEGKNKLLEYGISPPVTISVNKKALLLGQEPDIICPRCKSHNTLMVSQFGSTACKALYKCRRYISATIVLSRLTTLNAFDTKPGFAPGFGS